MADEWFEVDISTLSPEAQGCFKQLWSAAYDVSNSAWHFDAWDNQNEHERILQALLETADIEKVRAAIFQPAAKVGA